MGSQQAPLSVTENRELLVLVNGIECNVLIPPYCSKREANAQVGKQPMRTTDELTVTYMHAFVGRTPSSLWARRLASYPPAVERIGSDPTFVATAPVVRPGPSHTRAESPEPPHSCASRVRHALQIERPRGLVDPVRVFQISLVSVSVVRPVAARTLLVHPRVAEQRWHPAFFDASRTSQYCSNSPLLVGPNRFGSNLFPVAVLQDVNRFATTSCHLRPVWLSSPL